MDFSQYLGRFADLVLTRDPAQRVRLAMSVNAGGYYVLYGVLLVVQIELGIATPWLTWPLVAAELVASAAFYAFIRSGHNKRFIADPSLTLAQLGVGLVFTMWAYAALGPGAIATLICVASQTVYTVFALPPRQVNIMVRASLVLIGITMVVCHQWQPERFPADVQAMAFLYACLVYPVIGSLATRVASMGEKLRAKSRELQAALSQVQDLATRDSLTEAYNRRHMTELIQAAQEQQRRRGGGFCLALLDIDHFKSVNDRYGHQAGDQVLMRFAQAARETLRSTDALSRWGGEEFMVLLPATTAAEALHALERLQQRLSATSLDDVAPGLCVSFSGGVAELQPGERLDVATERADRAMYRAKTQGRCRSLLAPVSDEAAAASAHDDHAGQRPAEANAGQRPAEAATAV